MSVKESGTPTDPGRVGEELLDPGERAAAAKDDGTSRAQKSRLIITAAATLFQD
jgi:hypothetical protein